jgi:hypothetical protein
MANASLADNTQVWRIVRDRTMYEKRVTPGEEDSDDPTYQRRWVWSLVLACRVTTDSIYVSTTQYNAIRQQEFTAVAGRVTKEGSEVLVPFVGTWYVDDCDIVHEMNGWSTITLHVSKEGDWPGHTAPGDYDVDAGTTTATTT